MTVDRRAVLGGVATTIVALTCPRAATKEPKDLEPLRFEAREGKLALVSGGETTVWGYNGQEPGPLLRIRKGDEVNVRLVNKLIQPTTLCWHGVRIANAMDGVGGLTQPPVPPGGSFDYRFTPPDSGLYWVHPHVFPQSAEQIGRGLYGVLIVDELDPPKVDEDLLVVIDDWALDTKGQIEGWTPTEPSAASAPLVTVNAKPAPASATVRPGARLRLRLLNVCSARIAIIGFDGLQTTVVAIDGQPCEIFQPAHTIPIGPGARFELMVDVPREAGKVAQLVLRGEKDTSLLVVRTKGEPLAPAAPVTKLPDNPLLPTRIPLERSQKHDFAIARVAAAKGSPWRWSLGGVSSDGISGEPLFSVRRGEAVTLAFANTTSDPQQMHVHGHVFRLLHDLDDGWDPYWRESLLLAPGKTKHIAFVADNPGTWAIESLMLDRQVTGLAGWFEVT